jgi:hypothetical protein
VRKGNPRTGERIVSEHRLLQALGAAISNRSWHDVEVAYNRLRDEPQEWITIPARDGIEARYGLNDTYPGDPVRIPAPPEGSASPDPVVDV